MYPSPAKRGTTWDARFEEQISQLDGCSKAQISGSYLEPQTTIKKLMFGETTIFHVKIGNHPIETTIYKWLFGVPGFAFFT